MKFPILKFKKDKAPVLLLLRPVIFDIYLRWFISLGLFFMLLLVMVLVGAKLFYFSYKEGYKKETSSEVLENLIDTNRLQNTIDKRINFITQEISFPRDPSL